MLPPYKFNDDILTEFFKLVTASNPGITLNQSTVEIASNPIRAAGEAFNNTRILLKAKSGANFYGARWFKYRRVDLSSNLPSRWFVVDLYDDALTPDNLLPWLNIRYGLNLVKEDFNTFNQTAAGLGAAIFSNVANNQGKLLLIDTTNALPWYWAKGLPTFEYLFKGKSKVLPMLSWDGAGVVGDLPAKPVGNYFLFGANCTELAGTFQSITSNTTFDPGNVTMHASILAMMQRLTPNLNFTSAAHTTTGGTTGLIFKRATLPSTAFPAAYSKGYNSVAVLSSSAGSWFVGDIYLHYNA